MSIEFEDVGDDGSIDVVLDDGVVIDGVEVLTVSDRSISLHDGETWHVFDLVRLPKSWARLIKAGLQYGVAREELS